MTQAPAQNGTPEPTGPPDNWRADGDSFGARLALVRQRLAWGNVREAATECGVPAESWRSWERDGRSPRNLAEVAQKIANRTGCDPAWLALGDQERVA
jgi:hypothetical protein